MFTNVIKYLTLVWFLENANVDLNLFFFPRINYTWKVENEDDFGGKIHTF